MVIIGVLPCTPVSRLLCAALVGRPRLDWLPCIGPTCAAADAALAVSLCRRLRHGRVTALFFITAGFWSLPWPAG